MTTTEYLQLIKAECERLLALSEKRTQGEWSVYEHRAYHTSYILRGGEKQNQLAQFFNYQDKGFDISSEENATYIAACAGRAEAGWRSTIFSINAINSLISLGYPTTGLEEDICEQWPIELLKP